MAWRWRGLGEMTWIGVCLAVSSAWCGSAAVKLGATWDEPTYVRYGLRSWQTGSSKALLDLGTMPLPCHVQTLPLFLWERAQGAHFDINRDLGRLLPVARWANLPFWWLVLLYGWLLGRQVGGPWGARLAILLMALEPNLLAHATLATTDTALTASLLAFWFHYHQGRDRSWGLRVGVPGLWLALCLACKASGPAFAALGMVGIEWERRWRSSVQPLSVIARLKSCASALVDQSFRRDAGQMLLLSLVLVFWYCGSDWRPSPSFIQWARLLPAGPTRAVMIWLAENLCIFTNAGSALARQLRHNIQGHGVFILEQVAHRAIWYYFPVALFIKLPVVLLALPLILLVVQRRVLATWSCLVAALLLAFSLMCRVQIGIRFMLPLISILIVTLAAALARAHHEMRRSRHSSVAMGLSLATCVWLGWSAWSVFPLGLCYTNELWGGTSTGYRCLSDSNYDWGQGLKELACWQEKKKVADLDVLYYGTDPALARLPARVLNAGSFSLDASGSLPLSMQGRTLAVGTSILFNSLEFENPEMGRIAAALRRFKPVDRTSTFLIYHFPTQQSLVIPRPTAEPGPN